MSELSPKTRALVGKAREARLPSQTRLAPTGVELQDKLERLESKRNSPMAMRTLAIAVVLLCLVVASSVAAYEIIYGFITRPDNAGERTPAPPQSPQRQPEKQHHTPTAPSHARRPAELVSQDEPIEDAQETPEPRTATSLRASVPTSLPVASSEPQAPDEVQLTPETLIEETRLLTQAQSALRNHQPQEALRHLDEHGRRFPEGTLSHERRAAQLVAQCQLGPSEELRERAERFVARHPNSIYTSRIRSDCLR